MNQKCADVKRGGNLWEKSENLWNGLNYKFLKVLFSEGRFLLFDNRGQQQAKITIVCTHIKVNCSSFTYLSFIKPIKMNAPICAEILGILGMLFGAVLLITFDPIYNVIIEKVILHI